MRKPVVPPSDVIAKEIPECPTYWVTMCGHVWSGRRGRYLKNSITTNGYYVVVPTIDWRPFPRLVHRLVAMAFLPGPEMRLVRHLDGNPLNNRIDNLAWGTHQDNLMDEVRAGHTVNGSHNYCAKLNPDKVRDMRARHDAGESFRSIADEFHVNPVALFNAYHRKTWKHVT